MSKHVRFIRPLAALVLGGSAIGAHAQHSGRLVGSVPVPTELARGHGRLVTLARSPASRSMWKRIGRCGGVNVGARESIVDAVSGDIVRNEVRR